MFPATLQPGAHVSDPRPPVPRTAGTGVNPSLNRAARTGQPTEDQQLFRSPSAARRREPERAAEFTRSDPWRVLRIMGEFVEGFDALATVGPAVSIFGSARIAEGDPMYRAALELSRELA